MSKLRVRVVGETLVYHGDCLDALKLRPDNSIDAVITDPPYALSFMGKDWDSMHPDPAVWQHCWRILKPGGHLLSFGGTRTWHRLCCDIEDSGFEIRDSIAWLYGSGFPKSLDVSKAIDKAAGAQREVVGEKVSPFTYRPTMNISREKQAVQGYRPDGDAYAGESKQTPGEYQRFDVTAPATDAARQWQGWGTALKPAFEPIIVARKPFRGTVAANVAEHGTGALNIDACRVEGVRDRIDYGLAKSIRSQGTTYGKPTESADFDANKGRWPTNVVIDDTQAEELDRQTKDALHGAGHIRDGTEAVVSDSYNASSYQISPNQHMHRFGDSGGASRFFPTFKYQAKASTKERPVVDGVAHPPVKPLELMRWLVKLVAPQGGLILDPFAGSGTTVEAALLEGMACIAIEREEGYIPLIVTRIQGLSYD